MPKKQVKKKPPAKPRATAKPKQTFIPGTEPIKIPEIEDALATYEMHKADRIKALALEVEAKTELIAQLHAHEKQLSKKDGYPHYKSHDQQLEVDLKPEGEKLAVKKVKQEDD